MEKLDVYISGYGRGITVARLDRGTGALEDPALIAEVSGASFIAIHPTIPVMYAVSDADGGSVVALVQRYGQRWQELSRIAAGGDGPCHLSVDRSGRAVFVACYGSGRVGMLALADDGAFTGKSRIVQHDGSGPDAKRQEKSHAHSIYPHPDGRRVVSADLGCDAVYVYSPDFEHCELCESQKVMTVPGAGPRHITFSPDGRRMYVVTELANTVEVYDVSDPPRRLQSLSTLPAGYSDASYCAEIRIHPTGRFVYTSNRGHDSISTFAVDPKEGTLRFVTTTATGGNWPRGFEVDPTGSWLIAANQRSNQVSVFRLDSQSGVPFATPHAIEIEKPACVRFAASFP